MRTNIDQSRVIAVENHKRTSQSDMNGGHFGADNPTLLAKEGIWVDYKTVNQFFFAGKAHN